jgi:hypothetical protein
MAQVVMGIFFLPKFTYITEKHVTGSSERGQKSSTLVRRASIRMMAYLDMNHSIVKCHVEYFAQQITTQFIYQEEGWREGMHG